MIETPVIPRVSETDGAGHINNTVIPIWFEGGRTEIFRLLTPDLQFQNWRVALVNMNVDYMAQTYFQEEALVRTWVDKVGTVENPTIIPSLNDHRIVGCAGGCTPEAPTWLRWFVVRENVKTECPDCGQIFALDKEAAQIPLE